MHIEQNWPAFQVERRQTDLLVPYARNARTHNEAQINQIVASIREWGWTQPILVDEEDGVIAGHGRLEAAKQLQIAEVPVIVARGWSEAQKRAYVLADNQLALNSGWDENLLKVEIGALQDLKFDVGLVGFGDDFLADIFATKEGNVEPDQIPPVEAKAVSVLGDIWELGSHRIICGDATSQDTWEKLNANGATLVFTSPPYGVGENAKLRDKYVRGAKERKSLYVSHQDDPTMWSSLMEKWTQLAIENSQCVVCNVQSLANNKTALINWQYKFRDHIADVAIWDKGHGAPQMQHNVLSNAFEWIFVLSKKQFPSRALPLSNFHGSESNMIRIGKGNREFSDVHRATMPTELAQWAIDVAGKKADCIIDPFGGTGTTLIAAEISNKPARLIEIEPAYVDVAVRRWEAFTGKTAVLAGDGRSFAEIQKVRHE